MSIEIITDCEHVNSRPNADLKSLVPRTHEEMGTLIILYLSNVSCVDQQKELISCSDADNTLSQTNWKEIIQGIS